MGISFGGRPECDYCGTLPKCQRKGTIANSRWKEEGDEE